MATLAKVTSTTRFILKWGIILVISLIVLTTAGRELRNRFFPPPPPAPTVAFGKLPPLKFPQSVTSKKFSYSLETLTGILPPLPSQVKVYQTVSGQPGLLSLQKAREKVARLGLTKEETALSSTVYQWTDGQEMGQRIKFNIVTNDFDLTSNFYNNPLVLAAENLPDSQKSQEIAKNFFSQFNLLPADIGETKVSLWAIQKNNLLPTPSFSNAQIVRVDLFQKSVNNLPIVYPKKDTSSIFVLIGSGEREGQVVEAHFFYRQANLNNSSTYPIKTPQEAFDELKKNEASVYIVNISDERKTDMAIKNVSLGYYLDSENQDFFYPVFVFEGDNSFLAYVSAISPTLIQEPTR